MGPAGFCGAGLILQTMVCVSEPRLNSKIYAPGQLVGRAGRPPAPAAARSPHACGAQQPPAAAACVPPAPRRPASARGTGEAPGAPAGPDPGPAARAPQASPGAGLAAASRGSGRRWVRGHGERLGEVPGDLRRRKRGRTSRCLPPPGS